MAEAFNIKDATISVGGKVIYTGPMNMVHEPDPIEEFELPTSVDFKFSWNRSGRKRRTRKMRKKR